MEGWREGGRERGRVHGWEVQVFCFLLFLLHWLLVFSVYGIIICIVQIFLCLSSFPSVYTGVVALNTAMQGCSHCFVSPKQMFMFVVKQWC